MNVEAMEDFFINKQKEEEGREEQLGLAPEPGPGKAPGFGKSRRLESDA